MCYTFHEAATITCLPYEKNTIIVYTFLILLAILNGLFASDVILDTECYQSMFDEPRGGLIEALLVHAPGDRLAALEKQVCSLLEWQQVVITSSGRAFNEKPAPVIANGALSRTTTYQQITHPIVDLPVNSKPDKHCTSPATQILDILERYGHNANYSEPRWLGKIDFLPAIQRDIDSTKPVRMIIPAFPFKSPNKVDKVIGTLPDLGEELALAHLNGLCETIIEVYKPGAEVTILSDGIVYSGKVFNLSSLKIRRKSTNERCRYYWRCG